MFHHPDENIFCNQQQKNQINLPHQKSLSRPASATSTRKFSNKKQKHLKRKRKDKYAWRFLFFNVNRLIL